VLLGMLLGATRTFAVAHICRNARL
jgi:hypothetical protein